MKITCLLMDGILPFAFAVPPMDLIISERQNVRSLRVIDFGEMAKMGEKDCARIRFSSFFPGLKSHFYKPLLNPLPPAVCLEVLTALKDRKAELTFMVPEFFIFYRCKIESITKLYTERTGDIGFELTLVEHRDPQDVSLLTGLRKRWL